MKFEVKGLFQFEVNVYLSPTLYILPDILYIVAGQHEAGLQLVE